MRQYPKNCIVIAGRTGAGKTELAKAISAQFDIPFIGFGDAVRAEAKSRGLDSHKKDVLQQLGQEMVETHPIEFCKSVLDMAHINLDWLTVEGLRHLKIFDALKSILPSSKVLLIHVHAPREARFERMKISRGWSESQCESYEGDVTELEVDTLLAGIADLSIDNSGGVEQLHVSTRELLTSMVRP